jgi:hypothetical protein
LHPEQVEAVQLLQLPEPPPDEASEPLPVDIPNTENIF